MKPLPPASAHETDYCNECPLATRQYVPGEGYSDCPCLVVGTAPGAKEEETLRPFSGPGGELVRTVLSGGGVGGRCFLTNVLKRRPVGPNGSNRKPSKSECWKCGSHLMTEIARHRPQIVITVGQLPLTFFMGSLEISQVHGLPLRLTKWNQEMIVVPLYDPSYVLRRGGLTGPLGDQWLSDAEDAVNEIRRRGI
jgi:uracil-DNA glycosylase family 4